MKRNDIYIGSVRDSFDTWHPVIASPEEEICHQVCQRIADGVSDESFYTDQYTVEIVPIVVQSLDSEEIEDERWYYIGEWIDFEYDNLFDDSSGQLVNDD